MIFYIFLSILFICIIEGLLCQPQIDYVIRRQIAIISWESNDNLPFNFCSENNFFFSFWEEKGFVESLQSIFLFSAIIILIKFLKNLKKKIRLINLFIQLHIIGLIYFFGEEISWGQHYFNWLTPDFFKIYNNQNETNIHNISNIFDQLPRTLTLIWCGLSVPIILILNNFLKINKNIYFLICPNKKLIFLSITLLFFVLPDLIIDKFNLHPERSNIIEPFFNSAYFYDIISFNFIRLSEMHELIFSFYFFYYSYLILKNLNQKSIYQSNSTG